MSILQSAKGFVKELKKYEGIDDRKLHIEIGDETNFYSDIGKGDIWNIKKMKILSTQWDTLWDTLSVTIYQQENTEMDFLTNGMITTLKILNMGIMRMNF